MQTQIKTGPLYRGLARLVWSWFVANIISLIAFFGSIHFLPNHEIAMMAALTILAAAFFVSLELARRGKTNPIWQYICSQLTFCGAVYAAVASLFVAGSFIAASFIYGGITFVFMFFNLAEAAKVSTHGAYVPIHIISAVIAFIASYFHFMGN